MDENMEFYGDYLSTLNLAADSFLRRLSTLEQACIDEKRRFPVEHYKSRIKNAGSVKAKLERLGLPGTLESAKKNLSDLVGIRLVCRFFFEVHETVQIFQGVTELRVIKMKDYVKTPKSNGYRSVHLIVCMPVQSGETISHQNIEIQIRTIAMDFWASLEHELKYKRHISDAKLMSEELKRCADEIISVDLKMQTIYEWLNLPRDVDEESQG